MNKKNLVMLFFAAALGLSSCNDIQEMNLDFGDRTYINDYRGLIDAVNDQTLTLKDKLALIEDAIRNGSVNQQQALEAITVAINNLIEQVKNSTITTQQALDQIKAAIQAQTTSFENKMALLEAAIKNGFADQKAAIDLATAAIQSLKDEVAAGNLSQKEALQKIEAAIKAQTASFEGKLALIEAAIKNGFADQKAAIDLATAAIQSLKDEVAAGNLSQKEALEKIEAAIKAQTASFEGKLALLEAAIKNGFADMKLTIEATNLAIQALKAEVAAGNLTMKEALGKIEAAIQTQTTSLAAKIALLQSAIETGFANEQTAINNMSTAIKNAIDALKTEVNAGNTSTANYLSQLVTAFSTLNTNVATTNTKLGEIKDELVTTLADNGVTINSDGKSVFVTPEIWNDIEKSGKTSQLYNAFMDAIHDVTVPKVNNPIQVTPSADPSAWHKCARFENLGYDESTVQLVAGTLQPQTAANGKTVVKMIKAPSEVKFRVYDLEYCTYPNLYNIRVNDARGDYQIYGGASGNVTGSRAAIGEATSMAIPTTKLSSTIVYLKSYYEGRICDEVKAYVFTYSSTSNLPTLFWPADAPK